MNTRVLRLNPQKFDAAELKEAAECVRGGGLVAIPTETVYGIAASLDHPGAKERLLELRGSPGEKHLTLHAASREDALPQVAQPVPPAGLRLIRRFWPGPLTIVFPAKGGGTLGVRVPDHSVVRAFLKLAGCRVVAPSANRSGQPPAVDAETVQKTFDGTLDFIIDGGPSRYRTASTVVEVGGAEGFRVLREGALPASRLEDAGRKSILFVCTGNTCRSPMAEALFKTLLAAKLKVRPDKLESMGYRLASAGTAAGAGAPVSEYAFDAVEELGADLSGHQSRPVTVTMVEEADRVYVMTESHRTTLKEWLPECAGRIELLDPDGKPVEDPVGSELQVYRECARRIRELLNLRLSEGVLS